MRCFLILVFQVDVNNWKLLFLYFLVEILIGVLIVIVSIVWAVRVAIVIVRIYLIYLVFHCLVVLPHYLLLDV